jgi:3-oxoacyl-(acyl-carrier-protein) synthase
LTRRVVITGIGVVTPFGDLSDSRSAVSARRSALGEVQTFDAGSFAETRSGQCTSFDPLPWFRIQKSLKIADQRTRLAVTAAGMAVADSRLQPDAVQDAAVVVGTSCSDVQTEQCAVAVGTPQEGDIRDTDYFGARILRRLNPLWLLVNLANMASAHIAIQIEARGPNSTITTDWIAGLQAIGEAARWIAQNEADVAIAGGADCGVLPFAYVSMEQAGILGQGQRTFVPSEGAAMFALEEYEHAERRGARILGEVKGYASANGKQSLAASMAAALRESGTNSVDLLCEAAVFTATQSRDENEAIAQTFSTPPQRFECNSLIGHALAAASPIALALALSDAPPGAVLLSNASGFMEQATSVVVTRGNHASH